MEECGIQQNEPWGYITVLLRQPDTERINAWVKSHKQTGQPQPRLRSRFLDAAVRCGMPNSARDYRRLGSRTGVK